MEDRELVHKDIPMRQRVTSGIQKIDSLLQKPIEPSGPPPQDLYWLCPICGPIEPFFVPFGKGYWVGGSCPCKKRKREEQEQSAFLEAWQIEQKRRTFSWLGKGWEEGDGLADKTFDTFDRKRQPKGYVSAVGFAHNPEGNLAFEGTFGTGKTHLMVAIIAVLREKGIASLFVSATMLFAAYNERMMHEGDHWAIVKQVISTPVFFLDDIDKARHTPAREEMFNLIFNGRANAKRPTVISTNKLDTISDYIGLANASRLMIGLQVAEMVGKDYREEI